MTTISRLREPASAITHFIAMVLAIAGLVPENKLSEDNIMPEAFDPCVAEVVANAVKAHIK